ncbi:MAG TPA: hypothetical protein PKE02_12150, partial [Methyloceanibacter sp.]|nr:hypothetical protein [Methyloceanibacter sp.]
VARGGSAGPGPHHALFERAQARSPGAAVAADYRLDDDGMLSILVPAEAGGAGRGGGGAFGAALGGGAAAG